jgi:hypothetical protein
MSKRIICLVIGLLLLTSLGYCANVTDSNKGSKNYILINDGTGQGHKGTWTDITTIPSLKGEQGITGKTGKDGQKGERGDTGKGLKDQYKVGMGVRIFDTKKTTGEIYYNRDFGNDNNETGIKFTIKLGTSYEEREIIKTNTRLDRLEQKLGATTIIEKVIDTKGNIKSIRISGNKLISDNKF